MEKKSKTRKKQVWYNNGVVNKKFDFDVIPPEEFKKGRIIDKEKEKTALEKRKQTLIEKYGVDNIMHNQEYKDKVKKTCLEKYGTETPWESDLVKEKIKKTVQEKYGCDNIFQVDSIKEKSNKTKLEKYGFVNNFSNAKILEKAIKNSSTPEALVKRQTTMMKKYGKKSVVNAIYKTDSKPNLEFISTLKNYGITEIEREIYLDSRYFDFKIGNILFEVDPTATHNSTWGTFGNPKSKKYHFEKTQIAINNGYKCVHIFDWDNIDKLIKTFILPKPHTMARKCKVKQPSKSEVREFLDTYHLQGYSRYSIAYGLYLNDKLISLMTFGKPRYNKKYEYELIRYCSSYNITGGAEKLFKHFILDYQPKSIISYCDMSKFSGNLYINLGFKFLNFSIGKHWYNIKTKKHITNNLLVAQGFDRLLGKEYGVFGKGTSNDELMRLHKFVEVYDAGQSTFIWNSGDV